MLGRVPKKRECALRSEWRAVEVRIKGVLSTGTAGPRPPGGHELDLLWQQQTDWRGRRRVGGGVGELAGAI